MKTIVKSLVWVALFFLVTLALWVYMAQPTLTTHPRSTLRVDPERLRAGVESMACTARAGAASALGSESSAPPVTRNLRPAGCTALAFPACRGVLGSRAVAGKLAVVRASGGRPGSLGPFSWRLAWIQKSPWPRSSARGGWTCRKPMSRSAGSPTLPHGSAARGPANASPAAFGAGPGVDLRPQRLDPR